MALVQDVMIGFGLATLVARADCSNVASPPPGGAEVDASTDPDPGDATVAASPDDGGDAESASADAAAPLPTAADATSASAVLVLDAAAAQAIGNGCTGAVDTTLSVSGSAVTTSFAALRIDLTASAAQTADRRACSIRIPAHVPRGYFLASIVQSFHYTAGKSADASLSASIHVALFSTNPPVLTQAWPAGAALPVGAGTASRVDVAGPGTSSYMAWCNPLRAEDDVLAIDVAVAGMKSVASADALVSIDSIEVRDGIELVFLRC